MKSMAILAIAVALLASTIGFADASGPPAWQDISNTPAGRNITTQALQRFQSKGWLPPNTGSVLGLVNQYKTYRFGDDEYLVAPSRGVKVSFITVNGKVEPVIQTFVGAEPGQSAITEQVFICFQ